MEIDTLFLDLRFWGKENWKIRVGNKMTLAPIPDFIISRITYDAQLQDYVLFNGQNRQVSIPKSQVVAIGYRTPD